MIDNDIRKKFLKISTQVIRGTNEFIKNKPLIINSSHPISHKTVSEIGGRILEDFISNAIKESLKGQEEYQLDNLSSRSLGDFCIKNKNSNFGNFYFDVKSQHLSIRQKTYEYYKENGIDQKKPGESHPNLISYQKALEFYDDEGKSKDDIGLIFVKYDPEIQGKNINFNILPFDPTSIILLRDIDDGNLSYGNLGKGQIQLSRVNNIKMRERSKPEFIDYLKFLKNRPRQVRKTSRV